MLMAIAICHEKITHFTRGIFPYARKISHIIQIIWLQAMCPQVITYYLPMYVCLWLFYIIIMFSIMQTSNWIIVELYIAT